MNHPINTRYCTSGGVITNLFPMKPYYACACVQHTVSTVQSSKNGCYRYSVPHEESKRMLGMCDVTSIAVIH